jgi:RIO-like serine/threonine protein kinase
MKLDVNVLRYLSKEDFRVLTSVEMGQKNVSGKQDMHISQDSSLF